ncbi:MULTISPECIES: flagellar basal body rod protein FlgB [Saccharibacillus]|uniref:Flagellar basal body rod protein FlgB n=1 Tax=Saccharibacillus brassicae TaxID=2583377 RepID=A0A4Y6V2F4_SACBS|nr:MULTISPECIES: flagellar basal body rod protein FlgB [Saccharibacillus]MWJ29641.1 flagellar basal body rod protein FlgB [Saccharibacillus sp. WB 17]QDH22846.1 flagellar basal body rod protein FlgB [Saccharibacillus brassicae]
MNILNDTGFTRLRSAIDASNTRQQVISNNVANADTPYFKRSEVSFESLLQSEMNGVSSIKGRMTNARHIEIGSAGSIPTARITSDKSTAMNNNKNNVDIDTEMTSLAENQLRYNTYIEEVNHQIKMMRTALGGNG